MLHCRWGRNQEVPSEDPYLNGVFGTMYTVGLQNGTDPRYLQAVVTLKHWDAYSLENSDGYTRHDFNAIIDNQTLYAPSIRPFNSNPMAVNSIPSGSPHARCTPMGVHRTCGA